MTGHSLTAFCVCALQIVPTDSDVSSHDGGDHVIDLESAAVPVIQNGHRSTSKSQSNRYSAPPDLYQVCLKRSVCLKWHTGILFVLFVQNLHYIVHSNTNVTHMFLCTHDLSFQCDMSNDRQDLASLS